VTRWRHGALPCPDFATAVRMAILSPGRELTGPRSDPRLRQLDDDSAINPPPTRERAPDPTAISRPRALTHVGVGPSRSRVDSGWGFSARRVFVSDRGHRSGTASSPRAPEAPTGPEGWRTASPQFRPPHGLMDAPRNTAKTTRNPQNILAIYLPFLCKTC